MRRTINFQEECVLLHRTLRQVRNAQEVEVEVEVEVKVEVEAEVEVEVLVVNSVILNNHLKKMRLLTMHSWYLMTR